MPAGGRVSRWLSRLTGKSELDIELELARRRGARRVLVYWNRGLGDISLSLFALAHRIRETIPGAEITFVTREDLREGFALLGGVRTAVVPGLLRGRDVPVGEAASRAGLDRSDFDLVFERLDTRKWFAWQTGSLTPRLRWSDAYDELWKPILGRKVGKGCVGVHVSTETIEYYGYTKDWPLEKWQGLFDRLHRKVILFGLHGSAEIKGENIVDLRGRTGLLEAFSIIKNLCDVFVAPDGGLLSLLYFLDVSFPITVVSLWADPDKGVLKQAVPSPNPRLRHVPLIGARGMDDISVDQVLGEVPEA